MRSTKEIVRRDVEALLADIGGHAVMTTYPSGQTEEITVPEDKIVGKGEWVDPEQVLKRAAESDPALLDVLVIGRIQGEDGESKLYVASSGDVEEATRLLEEGRAFLQERSEASDEPDDPEEGDDVKVTEGEA